MIKSNKFSKCLIQAIHIKERLNREGSALLITTISAFLISILAASSLRVVVNEYRMTKFSTVWAQALQTAEAGVDIALTTLHQSVEDGDAWDSWEYNGTDTYTMDYRALELLGNTGLASEYMITVNLSQGIITSTGRLNEPGSSKTLTRVVQVSLDSETIKPFSSAILGRDKVKLAGSCSIDSFNSKDS